MFTRRLKVQRGGGVVRVDAHPRFPAERCSLVARFELLAVGAEVHATNFGARGRTGDICAVGEEADRAEHDQECPNR